VQTPPRQNDIFDGAAAAIVSDAAPLYALVPRVAVSVEGLCRTIFEGDHVVEAEPVAPLVAEVGEVALFASVVKTSGSPA